MEWKIMMESRQKPMPIDEHNWYYEYPDEVILVHEVYSNGEFLQTDSIPIPWKRLLESVRRKYGK